MQLGLIGLGRMGGNMRDRVRAAGPRGDRLRPAAGGHGRRVAAGAGRSAAGAPGRLGDGAVRRPHPRDRPQARRGARTGRPGDRRRQLPLHRRRAERGAARPARHRFRRLRGLRRDLGQGERLRPDGRRVGRAHRASHADLRRAAAGRPARGGFRARRAGRRGALREDGAQRHRVRPHAGLRRGLRADGRHRADHQRDRRDPGLVARHGRALVAAGPAGAGAQGRPGAGQAQRLRRRLG